MIIGQSLAASGDAGSLRFLSLIQKGGKIEEKNSENFEENKRNCVSRKMSVFCDSPLFCQWQQFPLLNIPPLAMKTQEAA